MNDYDVTYATVEHGQRAVSREEPACAPARTAGHCWHRIYPRNSTLTYPSRDHGYDEKCCWCAAVKQHRPKPDAHGPHHPDRHPLAYGAW